MKPPLLITTSSSLGDLLSVTPTLRKLFYTYKQQITVVSPFPDVLRNNPYILKNVHIDSVDQSTLEKFYTVHKTFHCVGKRDPLGIEFKHAMCDIRQFHAKDLGFLLTPEELTCDFFPDPEDDLTQKFNLPDKYVVIHPAQTWDSRTWEREKWQEIVNKLNSRGIYVVSIGKNSSEISDHINQDKPAWDLKISKGVDLTNKTNLSQSWHILNKSDAVITMDSGILHLAGTTDTFIVQLGSSINPRFRAPYRKGKQDYKYSYVGGSCQIHCASDLSYSLRDWGNIQAVTLIHTCLESKPTFECKPEVDLVLNEILKVLEKNEEELKKEIFPVVYKPEALEKIQPSKAEWSQEISITFNYGPKVEINGDEIDPRKFKVLFIDDVTGEVVYDTEIEINHWCKASRRWFTKWKIEVWCDGELLKSETLDLRGKKVLINLHSKALGDNIAWIPYCLEFKKVHDCQVTVKTFHVDLFKPSYHEELNFIPGNSNLDNNQNFYASYKVDVGVDMEEYNKEIKKINSNFAKGMRKVESLYSQNIKVWDEFTSPRNPHYIPLGAIGCDILGLEYKEIRPRIIDTSGGKRPIEKKYVCISEFASAPGLKMWNNQIGWQKLVDFLVGQGFEVVSISMEKSNLKKVTKRNGKIDLSDRVWYLQHCEFFIGVSSGLSWLAWACGKKVVMISGATETWNEFTEDNIRITNEEGCHGCWNSTEHSDKFACFHWTLCPENKNFECTRKISPGFVIDRIKEKGLV
jgi:ADP-heptose:LPS heptosyltransferase